MTARFAVRMLELSGVPVLLEGHIIAVAGSRWQVAQACSGINYLMSSLAIGFLYAGIAYRSWIHRIAFFLASGLVPLAGNGLRVYTTILIASLGGSRIASGMEHYLYGWLVFALMTYLLVATCGGWREDALDRKVEQGGSQIQHAFRPARRCPARCCSRLWACWLWGSRRCRPGCSGLHFGMTARRARILPMYPSPGRPFMVIRTPGRRASTPRARNSFAELCVGASCRALVHGVLRRGRIWRQAGQRVECAVFRAVVAHCRRPDAYLTIGAQSFQARETTLRSPESSLLVLNWYSVDGTFTGGDYLAKALLAKAGCSAIAGNPRQSRSRPRISPASTPARFSAIFSSTSRWRFQARADGLNSSAAVARRHQHAPPVGVHVDGRGVPDTDDVDDVFLPRLARKIATARAGRDRTGKIVVHAERVATGKRGITGGRESLRWPSKVIADRLTAGLA